MRILVYCETVDGTISSTSAGVLSLSRRLAADAAGSTDALVLAASRDAIPPAIDADRVIAVLDPGLEPYTPPAHAACLEKAIDELQPDLVLVGDTTVGLDLAAYVAVRLDRSFVGQCIELEREGDALVAESRIHGGRLISRTAVNLPAVVAVSPSKADPSAGAPARETIEIETPGARAGGAVTVVSVASPDPQAVDISTVDRLICIGRGIGDEDRVPEARELAKTLLGELVASRPLVDAGWLPKERQVGKSGRTVKPRLYLSLGVSGAPEHLEGMASAELIIAVNKDAKAPIFQVAHFGIAADVAAFMPALKKAVEERNG